MWTDRREEHASRMRLAAAGIKATDPARALRPGTPRKNAIRSALGYRHCIPLGLSGSRRLMWWRLIIDQIEQCSAAQTRATKARNKIKPAPTALNKWEELWLRRNQNPHNFPPPHAFPGSTLCDI